MTLDIVFAPHLPLWALVSLGVMAAAYLGIALAARAPGLLWRTLTLAVLLLALANPALLREERQNLPDIAVVVLDQSQSTGIGERTAQALKAQTALKQALGAIPQSELQIRYVTATDATSRTDAGVHALALGCCKPPKPVKG